MYTASLADAGSSSGQAASGTTYVADSPGFSGAAIDPSGGPPVVNTTITHEKGFAFIEFRRLEDAESALMFDGIVFNGSKLVIKRPKDYDAARNPIWAMRGQAPPQDEVKLIGEELPIGTIIVDGKEVKIPLPPPLPSEWPRLPRRTPNGPHKMYCGGFHPLHTDLQVRQVLQSVGELKCHNCQCRIRRGG